MFRTGVVIAPILSANGPPDIPRLEALAVRYGLTFQWDRLEEIMQQHDLRLQ